jgi:hypothetical protein
MKMSDPFQIGTLRQIGKIDHTSITVEAEPPRLQAQTRKLARASSPS